MEEKTRDYHLISETCMFLPLKKVHLTYVPGKKIIPRDFQCRYANNTTGRQAPICAEQRLRPKCMVYFHLKEKAEKNHKPRRPLGRLLISGLLSILAKFESQQPTNL